MLYKTTGHQVAHTTSLQTSIIAGLSFSPPSLVANYTSFNKAATDPGLAWSPGAKKPHMDELYIRRPKKLCGPRHHACSLSYVLKSSRQALLYNQY